MEELQSSSVFSFVSACTGSVVKLQTVNPITSPAVAHPCIQDPGTKLHFIFEIIPCFGNKSLKFILRDPMERSCRVFGKRIAVFTVENCKFVLWFTMSDPKSDLWEFGFGTGLTHPSEIWKQDVD